jgi:hypothetical protein
MVWCGTGLPWVRAHQQHLPDAGGGVVNRVCMPGWDQGSLAAWSIVPSALLFMCYTAIVQGQPSPPHTWPPPPAAAHHREPTRTRRPHTDTHTHTHTPHTHTHTGAGTGTRTPSQTHRVIRMLRLEQAEEFGHTAFHQHLGHVLCSRAGCGTYMRVKGHAHSALRPTPLPWSESSANSAAACSQTGALALCSLPQAQAHLQPAFNRPPHAQLPDTPYLAAV